MIPVQPERKGFKGLKVIQALLVLKVQPGRRAHRVFKV